MQRWLSQLVMGVLVTVIGTVIADSVLRGGGKRGGDHRSHYAGSFSPRR